MTIDVITNLIEKHIKYCRNEIENDVNMYTFHADKIIHDERYSAIIDELEELLEEIRDLNK